MFFHLAIRAEYPYRSSRRIRGIVRARAVYGVGMGDYSTGDLFRILRHNLPRAYRASGARFSISPGRPELSLKIKTKNIPPVGEIGERAIGLLGGLCLPKGPAFGLTGSGESPTLRNIF